MPVMPMEENRPLQVSFFTGGQVPPSDGEGMIQRTDCGSRRRSAPPAYRKSENLAAPFSSRGSWTAKLVGLVPVKRCRLGQLYLGGVVPLFQAQILGSEGLHTRSGPVTRRCSGRTPRSRPPEPSPAIGSGFRLHTRFTASEPITGTTHAAPRWSAIPENPRRVLALGHATLWTVLVTQGWAMSTNI